MLRLAVVVVLLGCLQAYSQDAEQVRQLQEKFRAERATLAKMGAEKRFLPVLLQRANDYAQRADAALEEGRLQQASEFYRQARWQLPYQSKQVPEHVSRVLGDLRLRHGQQINAVAFSADGRWLATGSRDRTVKIWDMENGHELLTYQGHNDHVRFIAFSPDGKQIASAGGGPDIKVWDPLTGKDIHTITPTAKDLGEMPKFTTCLVFAPDGKYIVTGHDDWTLRFYNANTGASKRLITDYRGQILSVAFNKDGSLMAAAVANGPVSLWEYPKVAENDTYPAYWTRQDPTGAAYDVAFSPDNRTLARCGPDGIKFYQTPLPNSPIFVSNPYRTIGVPDLKRTFKKILFSKDGKTLYAGTNDGAIQVFSTENGQPREIFRGHSGAIRSLALEPGGAVLASAGDDFMVRLWRFDVVLQSRTLTGHTEAVWSASFSSDGGRILSAGADRTITIWDAASGQPLQKLSGHNAPVTMAVFSPDDKSILSAGGDKVLHLWDAQTGKTLRTLTGHQSTVTAAAFSPDGSKVLSGGADKLVKMWDAGTGKEIFTCEAKDAVVAAVAFAADGKHFATGHVDQTVRLCETASGKEVQRWIAHGEAVSGLAFSPDGRWLATCGFDHLVRLWPINGFDLVTQSPVTLSGHAGPLSSVAFRKDSKYLVSCGSDTVVKLWRLEGSAAREAQNFRGHDEWVTSVAFSPDGFYVVSASADGAMKIWEITSREIPLAAEHTGAVQAVAVSPDGKLIASGGTDRAIRLWNGDSGAEVRTIALEDEIYSLAFSPDSKILASTGDDRSIRLWDVAGGQELPQKKHGQVLTGLVNSIPLIAISSTGKTILAWVPSGERQTTITAFDYETAAELLSIQDNRNVQAVNFSANGKLAGLGAKDGTFRIYDLENKGQQLGADWMLFGKDVSSGDIAFSPDAKHVIVSNAKGELKVCDVETRKELHTIKAHDDIIHCCVVSPDGKVFATTSLTNEVAVWDLASGKELRRWNMNLARQESGAFVATMVFTPDSRRLVTANANTTVYVLDLPE